MASNPRDSTGLRKTSSIIIFKELFRHISGAARFEKHSAWQLQLWSINQMPHVTRKLVRIAEYQHKPAETESASYQDLPLLPQVANALSALRYEALV